jgi:hypothetical protein
LAEQMAQRLLERLEAESVACAQQARRLDAGAGREQFVPHFTESGRAANSGVGSNVGRDSRLPSVLVNSWLVIGCGATALEGPRNVSVISA